MKMMALQRKRRRNVPDYRVSVPGAQSENSRVFWGLVTTTGTAKTHPEDNHDRTGFFFLRFPSPRFSLLYTATQQGTGNGGGSPENRYELCYLFEICTG